MQQDQQALDYERSYSARSSDRVVNAISLHTRTRMDHKRGHGSLDHSNEQFTRVKRHKDYSYQQPGNSSQLPQNTSRSSRLQSCDSEGIQTRSSRVELASVEQLRAIAEKSAKSVNNLGRCILADDEAEKTVEEAAYEEFLPLLLAELSVLKLAAGCEWPICLTDRRVEKHCSICPFDRRFRGWEALLIHAAKFQKEKTRQHRGYYRALREALLQSTGEQVPLPDIRQGPTSPLSSRKRVSNGRWAPPVILMDEKDDEAGDEKEEEEEDSSCGSRRKKGQDRGAACRAKGLSIGPSRDPKLEEVLAVYSTGRNHHQKKVVVIPASQIRFIQTGLLKKACGLRASESADQSAIVSKFVEGRWPGAKIKKFVGRADLGARNDTCSVASSASNRAIQLGRQSSPENSQQRLLEIAEQEEKMAEECEELRLWKPLEEHRNIFDENQFDDKVKTLVSKWKDGFSSVLRKENNFSMGLGAHERNLLQRRKMPKTEIEKHERFKDDVEKYALLNPSCRKQVSRQITVLEDELRRDKLVWLQEVEAVREQFQALADSVHDEQVERDEATMRIEKHLDIRARNINERIYDKKDLFIARNNQCMQNVRRIRREQLMEGLTDLWRKEQRTFEKECQNATKEKKKLIGLHDKIHKKAKESKRKECPICLEKWDLTIENRSFLGPFRISK